MSDNNDDNGDDDTMSDENNAICDAQSLYLGFHNKEV